MKVIASQCTCCNAYASEDDLIDGLCTKCEASELEEQFWKEYDNQVADDYKNWLHSNEEDMFMEEELVGFFDRQFDERFDDDGMAS